MMTDTAWPTNTVLISRKHKTELSEAGINAQTIAGILKGKSTNKKRLQNCRRGKDESIDFVYRSKYGGHVILTNAYAPLPAAAYHSKCRRTVGLANINPANRTKPPRVERTEKESLDDEDVSEMLALLEVEPLKYQAAVYIAVYGGLRVGEVTALRWRDIDFQSGRLSITKSRQYIAGIGNFEKSPKNESSKRELKLPAIALQKLSELKKEQTLARLKLGSQWIDDDNLFTQCNGEPMSPDTISHWFTRWIFKTELPQITFHGLRHSNASLLIARGTNIVTVSKRLGHSRTSTTTDIYTHTIGKTDEEAANTLDSIFPQINRILA